MIPKKAIEKAIEGGWKGLFMDDEGITVDTQSQIAWGRTKTGLGRHLPLQVIALDPTFWQALGKALGWPPQGNIKYHEHPELAKLTVGQIEERRPFIRAQVFYHLILTGGDIEKFWEEIL